jgi:hypothetical protein
MACPEPGAITVLRAVMRKAGVISASTAGMEGAAQCASN